MMWWSDYEPASWMFFGPVFVMVMLTVCVLMMVFMMRGHRGGHGDGSAQILNERYARGEIDKSEYDERRRVLGA